MATALQTRKPLKRSGIRRKKHRRSRDREKWTNNDWMKECDALWQRLIAGPCAVCASKPPSRRIKATRETVHHLISRACKYSRHAIENGIPLCVHHHIWSPQLSAHGAAWAFDTWMEKHRPEQYTWWARNRNRVFPGVKLNFRQVHDVLLAKLETHGEGDRDG